MDNKRILLYTPYVCSALTSIVGLPLALGLVPPNGLYGIRAVNTIESAEVWCKVNMAGGLAMVILGVVSAALVYALHRFWGTETKTKLLGALCVPTILTLYGIDIGLKAA